MNSCEGGLSENKGIPTGTGLAAWVRDWTVRTGVALHSMAPTGAGTTAFGLCQTRRHTGARRSAHDRGERARATWVFRPARPEVAAGP